MMNRYAQIASRRWQELAPERDALIPQPEELFAALGKQIALRVDALTDELAGPGPPGEAPHDEALRRETARVRAEAIAFDELAWLANPEDRPPGRAAPGGATPITSSGDTDRQLQLR